MRRKATGKLAPKVLSDKPTPHLKARLKLRAKRSIFSRFCTTTLAIVAVIWVFLEEWVWDSTLAAMQWIGKLPPIAWLEDRVKKLPPYAALVMFEVPAAVLLPFKLIAFWLIKTSAQLELIAMKQV